MNKIIFFLYLIISSNTFSIEKQPLNIITEEWPPYNYMENGEIKGFSYEIVKHIMNDLNINSKIKLLSSIRAEKTLNNKPRVIFFSLFKTPERNHKYKWIGPINHEKIYFYKKRGTPLVINTLDDAKKVKRISTRHHGLVYDYLTNKGFTNLDASANNESIYLKVAINRNELAIGETEFGVAYILKKLNHPIDLLEKTPVSILHYELYIAATKDISDSEIQEWQDSFEKMKSSGEYDKIYQKYLR